MSCTVLQVILPHFSNWLIYDGVNTLAQLPFNTVHMHDEVGGEDNSTVIDVNDDQINEKYDQSLLDVSDPAINVIGSDSVINDDLHVNFK